MTRFGPIEPDVLDGRLRQLGPDPGEVRGLFSDALGTLAAPYVASQGTNLGRRGRVHIDVADGDVWVGGDTTVTVVGTIAV